MIRALAELEVSCHTSCIDIPEIKYKLDSVHYEAIHICKEDDELNSAFDKFYNDIESQDSTYIKLQKVEEVKQI